MVTCGVAGCDASYSKCTSLVSHIYRKPRDCVITGESSKTTLLESSESANEPYLYESIVNPEPEAISSEIELQHTIDHLLGTDDEEQLKKSALYILNLKEIRGLSEAAVDHIVKETQELFKHTFGRLKGL